MADILMPASFPEADFRAFGITATAFFPGVVSDEVSEKALEHVGAPFWVTNMFLLKPLIDSYELLERAILMAREIVSEFWRMTAQESHGLTTPTPIV